MNGSYGSTGTNQQTGPKLIDDFLRRELRVGDPRNPAEVVTALRRRYAADAARMDQEAAGLPIRYEAQPLLLPAVPVADTPGSKEERRVQANLESDLAALIESRDNREWAPEIRGWRETLLREFSDGAAAARFAQDPAMRDRGFLAVRKLGEFARVARLVGVMNPPLNCDYRRLASTLDDAANVIRILMGEALYNAGLGDGGFVIQVPVFELRDRRDALVFAVRRLSGTEIDTDNDDWGDALAAYRALLNEVQQRGAPELRVYLRADLLASIVDGLITEVARQDPDGLRQVAATAPVEIARLTRLFEIANGLLAATAPGPITAALALFVRALQLFLDGFAAIGGGARLIDLAVPLPLAAQQADEPDREGRRVLRNLVGSRAEYAREVECFLSCCGCGTDELRCQVQLDKVLYDVDRSIDLYAQGTGAPPTWGLEEQRAGVYGLVARNLRDDRGCITPGAAFDVLLEIARSSLDLLEAVAQLATGAGVPLAQTQLATQTAAFLRHVLAASEAASASRPVAEGIRRALQNAPAVPIGAAAARFNAIVATAQAIPVGITEALQVLIDTIEFLIDVVAVNVNVAGVGRGGGGNAPFDLVVSVLAGGAFGPPLAVARATLLASRGALRAAFLTVGDPVVANAQPNRDAARNQALIVTGSIDAARQALNPPPPAIVTPAERIALNGAIEAATAAHDAAIRAAALPVTGQIEPLALSQALNELSELLAGPQSALPQDLAVRQRLIDAVFDEQLRCEQDWQNLVRSLAPRCLGPGRADLVLAGLDLLRASPRRRSRNDPGVLIPVPERQSLSLIPGSLSQFATEVAASAVAAGQSVGLAGAEAASAKADAVQAAQDANRAESAAIRAEQVAHQAETKLTGDDVDRLFDLLFFTWHLLNEEAKWKEVALWNRPETQNWIHRGWQGPERKGQALGQYDYQFSHVIGWTQQRPPRPPLSDLVKDVAGDFAHREFTMLFARVKEPDTSRAVEILGQKRHLLQVCFDVVSSYR